MCSDVIFNKMADESLNEQENEEAIMLSFSKENNLENRPTLFCRSTPKKKRKLIPSSS